MVMASGRGYARGGQRAAWAAMAGPYHIAPLVAPLIGGAISAIGSLFGGGKNTQQQNPKFDFADTGIYNLPPELRQYLGEEQFGVLQDLLGRYMQDPSGSGYGYSGGGAASSAGIDKNDIAYAPEAPGWLREDVYGRMKEGANASANDQIRKVMDSARLAGHGPNDPYVLDQIDKIRRGAASDSTSGLTNFYDQFMQGSLGRRVTADSVNANVGMNNANLAEQASRRSQSGFQFGAGMGQQNLGNILSLLESMQRPIDHLATINSGGSTTSQYQPGGADIVGGFSGLISKLLDGMNAPKATASFGGPTILGGPLGNMQPVNGG